MAYCLRQLTIDNLTALPLNPRQYAQHVADRRWSVSVIVSLVARSPRFPFEAVTMLIATRVLKLRHAGSDIEIPIRIFAPEPEPVDWLCRFEIDWPDEMLAAGAMGVDAVQALELALKMIGALIYASDHHASGKLMWLEPGKGYGFPVTKGIRDLLEGDDKGL